MTKIFLLANSAFVDIGDNYLLCIGTKEEVDKADALKLVEMIQEAITWGRFREISSSKGKTLH